MTHKDIFTKFMIEYDKANVTSSYPSLTEYEIATFLDKAYMALIAQKVTGNNIRRSALEADTKSVADLQPLITTKLLYFYPGDTQITIDDVLYDGDDDAQEIQTSINVADKKSRNPMPPGKKGSYTYNGDAGQVVEIGQSHAGANSAFRNRSIPDNVRSTRIPDDMLYFVSALTAVDVQKIAGVMNDEQFGEIENIIKPMDNKDSDYYVNYVKRYRAVPVQLTNHQTAQKFFATAHNIPWVKNPVCYIEDGYIYLVADPIVGIAEIAFDKNNGVESVNGRYAERLSLTYVKKPNLFVKDSLDQNDSFSEPSQSSTDEHKALWKFELNDVAAEELISLAISYALENVESPRLNAHLGIRGLES